MTLGYVVARDPEVQAKMTGTAVTLGLTASPFDCWLAERGLYSFELRYDRAEENAAKLADALAGLPNIERVLYPMRPDHPDHNRAVALLGGRGGNMVSFRIRGGRDAANRLVEAAPNIAFAPTLGDIGTTLSHPASSSHRALTAEGRAALGITEGFFRVSVGVEDAEHADRRVHQRHRRSRLVQMADRLFAAIDEGDVKTGAKCAYLGLDHARVRHVRGHYTQASAKAAVMQCLGKIEAVEGTVKAPATTRCRVSGSATTLR